MKILIYSEALFMMFDVASSFPVTLSYLPILGLVVVLIQSGPFRQPSLSGLLVHGLTCVIQGYTEGYWNRK